MNQTINAILFDLDGTLIDTAPDMVAALNILLEQHKQPTMAFADVRDTVSKGSLALVKLGFPAIQAEDEIRALQKEYLETYNQNLCIHSKLFDGMNTVLAHIESTNRPWGIVTNKPGWLAEPLIEQLGLHERTACLVSGDTLAKRKPHPEPLLHACELINKKPEECIYLGDDERDIQAGKAANMRTIAALYGYILETEDPEQWNADQMVKHASDIIPWI